MKKNEMNEKKQVAGRVLECPKCGKKTRSAKDNFCPACGIEVFTPEIDLKWNIRTISLIIVIVVTLYMLYLVFKPVLYYWLDQI
ncbi:MAG: hypothetical protein JXJ19_03515 [Elusimicrobia bacterium]|nr:hypothetical protein [Elusimicrobiota bacterium]